jgi:hypothetical protein
LRSPSSTKVNDSIEYRVSMVNPERHYFDVTIIMEAAAGPEPKPAKGSLLKL